MKKRITALFLSMAMLIGLMPANVFATEQDKSTASQTNSDQYVTLTKSAAWTSTGENKTEAEITFTAQGEPVESKGGNVVLVIDTSGSMGYDNNAIACLISQHEKFGDSYVCPVTGSTSASSLDGHRVKRMDAAKYLAKEFVSGLLAENPNYNFSITAFNRDVVPTGDGFTNDKDQVNKVIDALTAGEDSTNYSAAMESAITAIGKLSTEQQRLPTTVVFFTDGIPNPLSLAGKAEAQKLQEMVVGGAKVNLQCIGLGILSEPLKYAFLNNLVDPSYDANNFNNPEHQTPRPGVYGANDMNVLQDVFKQVASVIKETAAGRNLVLTDVLNERFEIDSSKELPAGVTAEKNPDGTTTITWKTTATTKEGVTVKVPIKVKAGDKAPMDQQNTNNSCELTYDDVDGKSTTLPVKSPQLDRVGEGIVVKYNANFGDMPEVKTQGYSYSETPYQVTTMASDTFEQAGYVFKEWNTNATGTGTSYAAGAQTTGIQTSTTLYAIWTEKQVKYQVFDGTTLREEKTVTYNTPLSFVPKPGTGEKLVGVSIVSTPEDAPHGLTETDGNVTGKLTADVVITYTYERDTDKWMQVTYNSNNKSAAADNIAKSVEATKEDGVTIADAKDLEGFVTEGYRFAGWSTEAASGMADENYKPEKKLHETADLYAQWEAKVTFTTNLGADKLGTGGKTSYTKPATDTLSFPEVSAPPRGYLAGAWYQQTTGDKVDDKTRPVDGATYEYRYTAIEEKVTVTFTAGEHGKLSGAASLTGYTGESISNMESDTEKIPTPTADTGYSFAGWYLNNAGDGITQENLGAQIITQSVGFTAKFEPNPHTITFNPNGGKINEQPTEGATVEDGKYVYDVKYDGTNFEKTLTATHNDGAKYKFLGWSTDKDALTSGANIVQKVEIAIITGDVEYFAIYAPQRTVNVTYYVQQTNGSYKALDAATVGDKGSFKVYMGDTFTIGTEVVTGKTTIAGWAGEPEAYFTTAAAFGTATASKPTSGAYTDMQVIAAGDTDLTIGVYLDRRQFTVSVADGVNGQLTVRGAAGGTFYAGADYFVSAYSSEEVAKLLKQPGYKFSAVDIIDSKNDPSPIGTSGLKAEGEKVSGKLTGSVSVQFKYDIDPAQWFNVRFNANDGSSTKSVDSALTLKGTEVKVLKEVPTFTNQRYVFSGWSYDKEGKQPVGAEDQKTIAADSIDKYIEVHAQWKADVTYFVQGGTFGDTTDTKQENTYKDPATVNDIKVPTDMKPNEGYKNTGTWYPADADGKPTGAAIVGTPAPKDGDRFVFVFDEKGTVKITFAIGNTAAANFDKTEETEAGKVEGSAYLNEAYKGNVPKVTTNDGWTQASWIVNVGGAEQSSDMTTVELQAFLKQPLAGDVIATATYTAKVKLDPNGGTMQEGQETELDVPGKDGTLPEINPPTKPNAEFDGWVDKETGNPYKPGDSVDKPLELVAQYRGTLLAKTHANPEGKADGSLRVGDQITYTITLKNTGSQALTNVALSDTMFADGSAQNVQLNGASATPADGKLTIAQLDADATATVTYTYTVAEKDVGKTIKNTAIVSGDGVVEKTVDEETGSTEQKYELLFNYAYQQLTNNGANTDLSGGGFPSNVVLLKEYAGVEIPASTVAEAIAQKMAGIALPAGNLTTYDFWRGDENGKYTTSTPEATAVTLNTSANANHIKVTYPLERFTLTYQPGNTAQGTIALADGSKGEMQADGSIVYSIPYGAIPSKWFSTDALHGTLEPTKTPQAGFAFLQWQVGGLGISYADALNTPATSNMSFTPDWRSETAAYKVVMYVEGNAEPFYTMNQNAAITPGADSTAVKLDGGVLLTTARAEGATLSGDYTLSRFDPTQPEAGFTVLANGTTVINAYYASTGGNGGGGGGGGGGGNTGGGGGGGGDVIIPEEDVPLAGLEMIDHYAYVIGYPDGGIHPEAQIDRQETATIFFRLLDNLSRSMNWDTSVYYNDTWKGLWSNNAIATMTTAKIVTGYPDGNFRPEAPITRAEFAAIAARFDSVTYEGEDKFSDIGGHWAAALINRAAEKGWVNGYEDGTFRPDAYITRAEAMTLVNNVLNRRVKADGMLEGMNKWVDCTPSDWFYLAVQEATNSHDYDRETDLSEETWTKLNPARDWSLLEDELANAGSGMVVKETEGTTGTAGAAPMMQKGNKGSF